MKRACPELSRRALLGAAFAAPVLSIVEGPVLSFAEAPVLSLVEGPGPARRPAENPQSTLAPAPASPSFAVTKWDRVLSTFRRAERTLAWVAHTEDDALYDRALGGFNRALRALVRAPAPDLAALSAKIDLAVDHEVATLTGGEACMAALKRDARRLASIPSSRTR
jgi:hypothetical protein